jgi:putative transport protein
VQPDTMLQAGDCVALAARHEALVAASNPLRSEEVDDPQLLDIPTVEIDVVVTRKDLAGHSLAEVGEIIGHAAAGRGVFVRKITRAGQELPRALRTVLERGDVLTLVGAKVHIEHVASLIGTPEWPGLSTDLGAVSATIAIGGLVGLITVSLRGVEIGLSPAVGVLIGGLVLGWLRSTFPVLYRVPAAGVELLSSLGLTAFLAGVAVNAGPAFVTGLRDSGAVLLVSGVVLGALPHALTVLFGRYVLRMNPVLLLGITAGAGTAPTALAAVQDVARSKVPSLAYGVSYAVGNVLLTLWGAAVVLILAT